MGNSRKIAVLELATETVDAEQGLGEDGMSDSFIMQLLEEDSDNVDIIKTPITSQKRESLQALQAHVLQLHHALRDQYKAVLCLAPEKLLDPIAQTAYFSSSRSLQGDAALLFADERVRERDSDLNHMSLSVLNATSMSGKVGVLHKGGIYAVPRLDPDKANKRSTIAQWDHNWKFTTSKPHHELLEMPTVDIDHAVDGTILYNSKEASVNKVVEQLLANDNIAATLWQPDTQSASEIYETLSHDFRPSIMVVNGFNRGSNSADAAITKLNARSAYGLLIAYVLSSTRGQLQQVINQYELGFQVI